MKVARMTCICSVLALGWAFGTQENKQADPPDAAAELAAAELAEVEAPGNPVPENFREAYFGGRPEKFLTDPQGLLSPVDYRERLAFLNYHAGDSAIDLYVHVFPADQDIPREVRVEEVIERFFAGGRPAAVVHYFMGDPQRSALYLSPSLRAVVPAGEQRRALENSVMQALNEVHPAAQIEAFLVQMSIRIYWMERMLNSASAGEPAPVLTKTTKAPQPKAGPLDALRPHLENAKSHALAAAMIVAVLLSAAGMGFWLKRRTRHRFPEFEVEPRLGGAHAAGVGAVISFASAAVPPASQRDQMPDYLRRA